MPASATRVVRRPAAFTLIELLVSISVIMLLVSIALPSLGQARVAATRTQCQFNLRQIATASLVYETDYRRLPLHASEVGAGAAQKPWCFGSPAFNGRLIYRPYMDVNYFRCPFLPQLNYHSTAATHLFSNFNLLGGYVSTYDGSFTGQRWVRSSEPWTVIVAGERRFSTALVIDRMYRDDAGYDVINHIGKGDGFELQSVNTASAFGTAYRRDGVDVRADYTFNTGHTDGSVRVSRGQDWTESRVADVHDRSTGRFLVPLAR
jgi:type II secretory pathway pseudopilin PulG